MANVRVREQSCQCALPSARARRAAGEAAARADGRRKVSLAWCRGRTAEAGGVRSVGPRRAGACACLSAVSGGRANSCHREAQNVSGPTQKPFFLGRQGRAGGAGVRPPSLHVLSSPLVVRVPLRTHSPPPLAG